MCELQRAVAKLRPRLVPVCGRHAPPPDHAAMPKPHRTNPVHEPAPIESQIEFEPQDPAPSLGRAPATPTRPSGSGDASLWMLLGLGTLAAGVALAVLPGISWSAAKIATRLGELGVHSGVAVVGGMLLMVLGLVRRGQHAARAEMQYDASLLFEQIAAELVEIRSSMDGARTREAANAHQLDELRGQLALMRDTVVASVESLSPRDNSDALFQLAAGLDKLGLRFEQRLRLHHSTLQESVDELAATVEHSRRSLEEQLQARPTAEPVAQPDFEEPQHAPQSFAPAIEFAEHFAPIADPESGSLGLLDQFEDVSPALPRQKTGSQPQMLEAEFGQAHAQSQQDLERAARSVRANSTWDEQMMVEPGQDLDTKTKLLQLESLLSDDRLRSALEAMRRQS